MRFKDLLAAIGVLLATTAASAQTPSDPISGTWSDDGAGMVLKFDGQRGVTGTLLMKGRTSEQNPVIRAGSFDPATGALKLEGEDKGRDGVSGRYVIEGRLEKGILSGTYKFAGSSGTFAFTREPEIAQSSDDGVAKALRGGFDDVSGYILKAADLVPADKYTYQPTKDVRTFGQLVAHVVDGYNYFCAVGAGQKVEWSDATEKGATDKATLAQKLKQATGACQATYSGKAQLPELIKNNEHTNLHYGNLVTYMRMLGLKPPSS